MNDTTLSDNNGNTHQEERSASSAMAKIVREIAEQQRVTIKDAQFEWLERMDGTAHLVSVHLTTSKRV